MHKQKTPPVFSSFVWAGYECTFARTGKHTRLDMLAATKHDEYARIDYTLAKQIGVRTVREGLSWHQIDQGNTTYDFSRFEKILQIGRDEGMQQIWDLNHFDYPDTVDPFSPLFITRFAEYAKRAITVIRKYQKGTLFIAPINEISFSAWIGADRGWWAPFTKGRKNGFAFKKQLVKAAIAAMDAIWEEDQDVRFIHIDPFMRRRARPNARQSAVKSVLDFNTIVRWEAWDMLAGKTHPEAGGHPKYLDIIGVNYYFHNQEWVGSKTPRGMTFSAMDWDDPARISFADMVKEIEDRYRRPIVISETGSFGDLRFHWWERTLAQVNDALEVGQHIYGVCAYPTVDRPASVDYLIPRSGLWDFADNDLALLRIPHEKTLELITQYARMWKKRGGKNGESSQTAGTTGRPLHAA